MSPDETPNPEPETRNPEPPAPAAPAVRPLGVAEIRARFRYANDASALRHLQKMRRAGHAARIFGQLSTDEEHLALWYHEQFRPPPRPLPIDTLERGTRNVIAYMVKSGQMEIWPAGALEALRDRVEALEAKSAGLLSSPELRAARAEPGTRNPEPGTPEGEAAA